MKRIPIFLALLLFSALPALAQTEAGIVVGGSRRFIDKDTPKDPPDTVFKSSDFSFSNTSIELYWGLKMEDMAFKIKLGRMETEVAEGRRVQGSDRLFRRDVDGEVQHLDASVEYRFSEAFGRTGVFAGLGLYRLTGEDIESTNNFGWHVGLNADFPVSRRYGVIVESTYHQTRAAHKPAYLTIGAGLRFGH